MKISIAQPTYLPWLGYFDLMDQVDMFVLLDSVQFEKQSWQQRNRIKIPIGLQWLTVPVIFRGRSGQRIDEVEIRDPEFAVKHLRTIELNYRRTPYFDEYFPAVERIFRDYKKALLVDLNLQFLEWMRKILGITTPIVRSSSMQLEGRRSELLINICRFYQANTYISPLGSSVYLLNDLPRFNDGGMEVRFQNYNHPEYRQLFPPFQPFASTLDLIFNEGPRSPEIIRQGRRDFLTPAQVSALTTSVSQGVAPIAAKKMSAPAVSLRIATQQDCLLLWNWANDPAVRSASFSSEFISWPRHMQWFSEKLPNRSCRIFIAEILDGTPVGQVRLDFTQANSATVNVTIAQKFRRMGYASTLIKEVVETAFQQLNLDELHALIKPENQASLRTFERAGFVKTGVEHVGTLHGAMEALHYVRSRSIFHRITTAAPHYSEFKSFDHV